MDETQAQHEPAILVPFAGRQQAVDRLSQHLADPERLGAIGFSGRRQSGKTRLLAHFKQNAPATDLMVILDCGAHPWLNDQQFMHALARQCSEVVIEQGYLPSSANQLPETQDISRDWLRQEFLPGLYRVIRSNRKLVLLLDNAHRLIDGIENGDLSDDFGSYLRSLIGPQFGLVFTLDVAYEDRVDILKLLTPPNQTHRLMNLTESDIYQMMQSLFPGRITDDAINLIFKNSGGEPAISHQIAQHLYEIGQSVNEIGTQQVQAVIPMLINNLADEFHSIWQPLSIESKQILATVARLDYQNPLMAVTAGRIENWLIQTDFPLESIEIGAALRELEYGEIITTGASGTVSFASRLFQRWVLREAGQETPITFSHRSNDAANPAPVSRMVWVAIAIISALAVIMALVLSGSVLDEDPSETPIPTVTLLADD